MVANNGDNEGLFRAGFMESGSPIPVGDSKYLMINWIDNMSTYLVPQIQSLMVKFISMRSQI